MYDGPGILDIAGIIRFRNAASPATHSIRPSARSPRYLSNRDHFFWRSFRGRSSVHQLCHDLMHLTPRIDRGKQFVQTNVERSGEEPQLIFFHVHQPGFDLGQTHTADVPAQ